MSKPSLSHKVGLLAISRFLSSGVSLLIGIVVVRFLSQGDYGIYKQVSLFELLALQPVLYGIGGSAYFFFALKDVHRQRQHITNFLYLLFLAGLLTSTIAYSGAAWLAQLVHKPGAESLLRLYALGPIATCLNSSFGTLMIVENRVRQLVIGGISSSLLNAVGTILVLHEAPSPSMLVLVSVVVLWMSLVYNVWQTWDIVRNLPLTFDKRAFRSARSYLGSMLIQTAAGKIGYEADKAVTTYFMTPEQYATYVIGAREIPFIQSMTSSINAVLIPEMSSLWHTGKAVEIVRIWRRAVRKTSLVLLPTFAFLFVHAGNVITLLSSQEYWESAPVFRIYLLLLPLRTATYGLIFQAIGEMKYVVRAIFLFLGLSLVANVILIDVLGLTGPAWAIVLATYAIAAYYIVELRRFFKISALELLPIKELLHVFLLTLPPAVLSVATSHIFGQYSQLVELGSACLTFGVAYGVLIVLLEPTARSLWLWVFSRSRSCFPHVHGN
jgi:O-antigen/teichoic acid export membrane protein